MSFSWVKFIELANFLHLHNTEEGFRTALSRAYYEVFCLIRNYKGLKTYTKSDVHTIFKELLKNSKNPKEREIGQLLDDLRKERNRADCDEETKITKEISELCILKAKKILEMMK
jgi:uncharacterized protein (UPF0332 family)